MLADASRGIEPSGLSIDHAAMQRILGAEPARYAAARGAFEALCQGAVDPAQAVRAAGASAPLVTELLGAIVAQAEVAGDPYPVAHARAVAKAYDEALAAVASAPVALEGARSFVTLVRAEELIEAPELVGAFAGAFDASSDATLVIHAPGWSDGRVASELVPALSAAGLDGPFAPDAMAFTAAADLSGSVHAVLSGGEPDGPLADVPHVRAGASEVLRRLARELG